VTVACVHLDDWSLELACGLPLAEHTIRTLFAMGLRTITLVGGPRDLPEVLAVHDRTATAPKSVKLHVWGSSPLVDRNDVAEAGSGSVVAGAQRVIDPVGLHVIEETLFERRAHQLRLRGARIRGRARIDYTTEVAAGALIDDGVQLVGKTSVAEGATILAGAIVTDSTIGPRAIVRAYSVVTSSTIGAGTFVGPFAHVRPATTLHEDVRVGAFVETKNVVMKRGAMANHLAFLGDGEVGERANVSAGSIFCNSDGYNKHTTIVEDGAFVGSSCQLVAPVRVGAGAIVASGTTVTADVPPDALAIARVPQVNKPGVASKLRRRYLAKRDGGR
jgi:bifunctional UDP-N-acetylglucosamine pyrophosphorylase/glucosamine-1-phosphate N-acetyltransferase